MKIMEFLKSEKWKSCLEANKLNLRCLGLKIISINKANTYKYSNGINGCHAPTTTDITVRWYSYSNHKHSVTTVCEVKHDSTQTSIKAFVCEANSSYTKLSVRRGHRYALQTS